MPLGLALYSSVLSNQSLTLTHCSAQSLSLSRTCQSYTLLSVVAYDMDGTSGIGMASFRSEISFILESLYLAIFVTLIRVVGRS